MASYTNITNTLDFSVAFKPTSAFPLDARSMFGSYAAAAAAAQTAQPAGSAESIYYIGQRLTVFEDDVVSTYLIQADRSLKAIGAQVIGDNKTIVVGESGEIGLKSFGVQYYKYVPADTIISGDYTYPDGMPADATEGSYVKIGDGWYVYQGGTWVVYSGTEPSSTSNYVLTTGWKSGLEPRVIQTSDGYEVAWYEPSTTTVEGLNTTVSSLQHDVAVLTTKADAVDGKISSAVAEETARAEAEEAALSNRLDTVEGAVDVLNGDVNTEGSVKQQIADAVAGIMDNPDETMNSIKELVEWTTEHGTEATELSNTVTQNTKDIEALETLVGTIPTESGATDVIDYVDKTVSSATEPLTTAQEELDERVTTVETTINGYGDIVTRNASEFASANQGALAESAVQSVTKGNTNGSINVDDTQVEVYTLPKATINELGGVKPDGTSIITNDEGVASVAAVDYTKVTGLEAQITAAKESAVKEANTYTDENAVSVKNVVESSTDLSDSVEAASGAKVVSEKALLEALEWKTTM